MDYGPGFPHGSSGKDHTCRKRKRCWFDPWVRKIPWRRSWQPTSVFVPGESHEQRSLVRSRPWGRKESDTTEATSHGCMDCSLPGSSVHGVLQARILKWVAISFGRGSFQPRDQNHVSCIAGRFFPTEPSGKPSWLCMEMYKLGLTFLLDLLCSGLPLPFLSLPAILWFTFTSLNGHGLTLNVLRPIGLQLLCAAAV